MVFCAYALIFSWPGIKQTHTNSNDFVTFPNHYHKKTADSSPMTGVLSYVCLIVFLLFPLASNDFPHAHGRLPFTIHCRPYCFAELPDSFPGFRSGGDWCYGYSYRFRNQPINQSITQSSNQSTNQSINHSIKQSINQPINQSINHTINQAVNK